MIPLGGPSVPEGIVGRSKAIQDALRLARRVAPHPVGVLIEGESGTGKEVFARAIHALSPRRDAPFVALDASAYPLELLESELFGHAKGAFTGADSARAGRLEQAHGGTLFIDEAGNLPPEVQVKLLRILESRSLTPLGSTRSLALDLRILSASHVPLKAEIAAGRFREDLYHRLNEFSITLPALRERKDDIPVLATHFREIFNLQLNRQCEGFSPLAIKELSRRTWPGNVRELRSAVKQAVILADAVIEPFHLPSLSQEPDPAPSPFKGRGVVPLWEAAQMVADSLEKTVISRTLSEESGNRAAAARRLQLNPKTLYKKIKRLGIKA